MQAENNQRWKKNPRVSGNGTLLPSPPPFVGSPHLSLGLHHPMGPRLLQHYRSRSASSFGRSPHTVDATSIGPAAADALDCPFGHLDGLSRADVRQAAYEVFFMSCRAGGKGASSALSPHPAPWDSGGGGDESPRIGAGPRGGTGMNVVNSRVKRALGLKARRSSQPSTALRMNSFSSSPSSAPGSPGRGVMNHHQPSGSPRARRPMTSAEIMRQQMRVSEQSDARLRKTLMRTLVGQVRSRPPAIV